MRHSANVAAADVAGAMRDLGVVAEVGEDGAPAAARSIGVLEHALQLLAGVRLQKLNLCGCQSGVVVANLVDEEFLRVPVHQADVQHALRGSSIAPGTA